jgi:hypothetical protein
LEDSVFPTVGAADANKFSGLDDEHHETGNQWLKLGSKMDRCLDSQADISSAFCQAEKVSLR